MTTFDRDVQRVIDAISAALEPALSSPIVEFREFLYGHLSQCVLSAVWSLGSSASAERGVVSRYVAYAGLTFSRPSRSSMLATVDQEPLDAFCRTIDVLGAERFATDVVKNHQRTSTRGGILKADAVHRFASVVVSHGVRYMQDVTSIMDDLSFEQDIRRIPGQTYGTSLAYFYMLVGSETHVKPDRMVLRFLERALGRPVSPSEALPLLTGAAHALRVRYPGLMPRMLDNYIWAFETSIPPS